MKQLTLVANIDFPRPWELIPSGPIYLRRGGVTRPLTFDMPYWVMCLETCLQTLHRAEPVLSFELWPVEDDPNIVRFAALEEGRKPIVCHLNLAMAEEMAELSGDPTGTLTTNYLVESALSHLLRKIEHDSSQHADTFEWSIRIARVTP